MINQIAATNISGRLYQKSETKPLTENSPAANIDAAKVSLNEKIVQYSSYTKKGELSIEPDNKYYQLGSIVSSLLTKQGMTISDAIDGKPYEIYTETQVEAKKLTADDGFWGVEQTADRIFHFAVNSVGDDISKLTDIKTAVEKGFNMALDSFGGTLPEISYKTYDAVLEKLDSWAEQSKETRITKEGSENLDSNEL